VEFLRQLLRGIAQAWARLSLSARVNIVAAGLVSAVVIGVLVAFGARPDYILLHRGLGREDASAIAESLDEMGVRYKIQENGETILVPSNKLRDVRRRLTIEGLPRVSGAVPGYDIFDTRQMMTNQFYQERDYERAIKGEITKQLTEIDYIRSAEVFIREAADTLFADEQKPSKATVVVDVARSLSRNDVSQLLAIVSSAAPNLHPDYVTLTTRQGYSLHKPPKDQFATQAGSTLEYTDDVERRLQEKIENAFFRMGKEAEVIVSADIDFSTVEEVSEDYDEEETVAVSTWTETTESDVTENLPEGAPGALAHLPEGLAVPGGVKTSESTERTVENIQPSKKVTKTQIPPGKPTAYTVSVAIEGDYEVDENGEETYVGLSPEQVKDFTEFVKSAVGANLQLNDIKVIDHPRARERLAVAAVEEVKFERWAALATQWAITVFKAAVIVVGFILVRHFLRRAMVLPPEEVEEIVEIPEATLEDLRRQEVAAEVERMSQESPDVVAAVLRSWLTEEG